MTASEKCTIVHQALVQNMMTKDIAKMHRVSQSTVTMLISKAKRKPKFVKELFTRDDIKIAKAK